MEQITCPLCGSSDIEDVFELHDVPAHACALYWTSKAARAVPRGDITLALCHSCSCAWNRTYDPTLTDYSTGYDGSLHHSPLYESFLRETADKLAATYNLTGGTVIEIGCGEGHFLRLLCERAGCNGIGIDPSGPKSIEKVGSQEIRYIREPMSERHIGIDAELVVSRQMFIYFTEPLAIARLMRRMEKPIYVEMPNAEYYFSTNTLWAVYYENIFYYSRASLGRLFTSAGLNVDVAPCYEDGQYLFAETRSGSLRDFTVDQGYLASVRAAGEYYRNSVEMWRRRLADEDPSRVVIWGAAGRGSTFANLVDPNAQFKAVVDNNPARTGTFVAGTGHSIVTPDSLLDLMPDLIIITNPTYELEIREQVTALGLSPRFAVVQATSSPTVSVPIDDLAAA